MDGQTNVKSTGATLVCWDPPLGSWKSMPKKNAYRETFSLKRRTNFLSLFFFFFAAAFCYFLCNRSDGNDDAVSNLPKLCTIFFPPFWNEPVLYFFYDYQKFLVVEFISFTFHISAKVQKFLHISIFNCLSSTHFLLVSPSLYTLTLITSTSQLRQLLDPPLLPAFLPSFRCYTNLYIKFPIFCVHVFLKANSGRLLRRKLIHRLLESKSVKEVKFTYIWFIFYVFNNIDIA